MKRTLTLIFVSLLFLIIIAERSILSQTTTTTPLSCNEACMFEGYSSGTCRSKCRSLETDIGAVWCSKSGWECCCYGEPVTTTSTTTTLMTTTTTTSTTTTMLITTTTSTTTTTTTTTSTTTTIPDNPPQWFNLRHNPLTVFVGQAVDILVDWWDDFGIQTVIIEENSTGVWVNHTVFG